MFVCPNSVGWVDRLKGSAPLMDLHAGQPNGNVSIGMGRVLDMRYKDVGLIGGNVSNLCESLLSRRSTQPTRHILIARRDLKRYI
jgi:hypothetical protein